MTPVRLILRADISGVGKRGDIVEVAPGYARNYLMPRGLALQAHPGATAQAQAMRRVRDLRNVKDREAAEEVARVLVAKTITIHARAGEGGKLFGSVTAADIVEALQAQAGVQVDRHAIRLDEHIKATGSHQVVVHLHTEVEFPVTVDVAAS